MVIFVEAKWEGDISLNDDALSLLENAKSVAVFASVQFLPIDKIKEQLSDKDILTTKAKRACEECQILGCDSYDDCFDENIIAKADKVLYVGDGKFHYTALLLSQIYAGLNKEVIVWNPIMQSVKVISPKDLFKTKQRMKGRLMKYLTAKNIGVLVSTKPGQNQIEMARRLKENKENVYIFVDDTFDFKHMEDYPFIDAWVNTACPRIGQDDDISIVNIKEALDPEKYLEILGK